MIKTKNLFFKYDKEFVLKNVSLKIGDGAFSAIIGSNGSGKTTLAKHFNALLMPSKGDVFVDGLNTKNNEFEARKNVGFVFQNFDDQLVYSVVEEDIAFGLENLGLNGVDVKRFTKKVLDKLGISNLAKKNVNTLSYGQKQLVALAGVLAMEPKYIVFDEPTTMLDAKNKKDIMNVIRDLNKKEPITIILITNVLDDLKYADMVIVLKDGRVLFNDKKSKLNNKMLKKAGLYD